MTEVINAILNFMQNAQKFLGWLFKYNSQIGASPITWILGGGLLSEFHPGKAMVHHDETCHMPYELVYVAFFVLTHLSNMSVYPYCRCEDCRERCCEDCQCICSAQNFAHRSHYVQRKTIPDSHDA